MGEVDWIEIVGIAIDMLAASGIATTVAVSIADYYNMWVKNGGSAEEMPWLTKIISSIGAGGGFTTEAIVHLLRLFVWLGFISVQTMTSFASWLLQKVKTLCGAAPIVAKCRVS